MARQQIGIILRPDVLLGRTGVYLTVPSHEFGLPTEIPQLWISPCRNLNFEKLLKDQCDDAGDSWRRNPTLNAFDSSSIRFDEDALSNAGDAIAKWQVQV